jgi:hypothetical protein
MRVSVLFHEDYWLLLSALLRALQVQDPGIAFSGVAARRSTVLSRIEALRQEGVNIGAHRWIGELEREWLAGAFDPEELARCRDKYGDDVLKRLLLCDRELAWGFLTGGEYARTPLRRMVKRDGARRWQYICGALRYYEEHFASFRPDVVLVPELTTTYELAAYHVANHSGIPCRTIAPTRVGDRLLLLDNPFNRTPAADALARLAVTHPEVLDACARARAEAFLRSFRAEPRQPGYAQHVTRQARTAGELRGFCRSIAVAVGKAVAGSIGMMGTRGFLRKRSAIDLIRESWRRFAAGRDALRGRGFEIPEGHRDSPFVLFPLHVEPEASIMVCAPYAANQLALVEDLARAMPPGFSLLVKEHAAMVGARPPGFYDRIRAMPDVVLVSPWADSYALIRRAALVATITGTAGWEAMLLGKPVIVFGECQYLGVGQGVRLIERRGELRQEVREAMLLDPAPDEVLIAFLAATEQESFAIPAEVYADAHFGGGAAAIAACKGEIQRMAAVIIAVGSPTAAGSPPAPPSRWTLRSGRCQ